MITSGICIPLLHMQIFIYDSYAGYIYTIHKDHMDDWDTYLL
jgi:hypothetical protein